jgi:alpha-L-arabinofuranosidase
MTKILGMVLLAVSAILPMSANAAQKVAIDVSKTGEQASPYIYGQFIEHLGRCIYGGIWAEMLEDRKFYFPITSDYAPYKSLTDTQYPVVGASPWQIVGKPAGIETTAKDAFVGDHAVVIREGSGIRQNDLGILSGKRYTGYIWTHSTGAKVSKLSVALVWGKGPNDRDTVVLTVPSGRYAKLPYSFSASASTDHASLELTATHGDTTVGTLSLMPADNVQGMRADTLALLKSLNGSIYRWPGGNFTSGYDWHDGIGDRDRRPPRKNPAWTGVEHNDFGTDEFIAFCKAVGTEPMIAVNTGFGDAYSAAQWVEYCNGRVDTLAGGWRAKNGHTKSYGVKRWCVGNEMFGPWQLGYLRLSQYELKHNMVADAMWKADPGILLAGVGDLDACNGDYDPETKASGEKWSHGMLVNCADHMNIISEHFYKGRLPWNDDKRFPLAVAVTQLKEGIREKADGHRALQASLPNLKGKTMPVSVDEWNYWHREYIYGELGCQYDMADALGVAEGLHEYYRQSDIIRMAFYAQTVNVIGAIKTSRTAAQMETTGLVLQMYRAHFGVTPIKLDKDYAPMDVMAALTADGSALTVGIVNPTATPAEIALKLTARDIKGKAARWTISNPDETAHNAPGQPRAIDIVKTPDIDAQSPLSVPAMSASIFVIPLQ